MKFGFKFPRENLFRHAKVANNAIRTSKELYSMVLIFEHLFQKPQPWMNTDRDAKLRINADLLKAEIEPNSAPLAISPKDF